MSTDILTRLQTGELTELEATSENKFPDTFDVELPLRGQAATTFEGRFCSYERLTLKVVKYGEMEEKKEVDDQLNILNTVRHDKIVEVLYVTKLEPGYLGMITAHSVCTLEYLLNNNIIQDSRRAICDMLQFLDYLQENKIIHRNLSPSNLLFFATGTLKLSGFDYATTDLTTSGEVGDPFYRAPEMTGDNQYDKEVDCYSLAILVLAIMINRNIEDSRIHKLIVFVPLHLVRRKLDQLLNGPRGERSQNVKFFWTVVHEFFVWPQTEKDDFFGGKLSDSEMESRLMTYLDYKLRCRNCEGKNVPYKTRTEPGCNFCGNPVDVPDSALLKMTPEEMKQIFQVLNATMLSLKTGEPMDATVSEGIEDKAHAIAAPALKKFLLAHGRIGGWGTTVSVKYTTVDQSNCMAVVLSTNISEFGDSPKARAVWATTQQEAREKVNGFVANGSTINEWVKCAPSEPVEMPSDSKSQALQADLWTLYANWRGEAMRSLFQYF